MAIGGFVEAPAGADYGGRVTSFVVLSCIVAGSGGILFGYDLGISGLSLYYYYYSSARFTFPFSCRLVKLRLY
jgi:hypothetical protein